MYLTLKFKRKILITGHMEVKKQTSCFLREVYDILHCDLEMITKNYFHVISVLC